MPTVTLDRHEATTGGQLRLRAADEAVLDEFAVEGILPSPPREQPTKGRWANDFTPSTEQPQETEKEVGPLIRLTRDAASRRRFDLLQQWEGIVNEVDDDAVWAEILDLTNRSSPSEVVEIPLLEFAVADRPLLHPGSVFYWSIGYETSPGGTIRRTSEIRVRRTAAWSQRRIDSLKARAHELIARHSNAEDDTARTQ